MKAVIFDMDGLLVDTEVISHNIYQILLEPLGIELTQDQYARLFSGKTEEANVAELIDRYHLNWSQTETLKRIEKLEESLIGQGVALKKGAKELLDYLKEEKIPTALATSSSYERALTILKQHDLESYFSHIITAKEISHSKPDPEIFLKACQKLGVAAEDALIFEDSEAGVMAASNGHIPVICIPDMKEPKESILDLAEKTYPDLALALEDLKRGK